MVLRAFFKGSEVIEWTSLMLHSAALLSQSLEVFFFFFFFLSWKHWLSKWKEKECHPIAYLCHSFGRCERLVTTNCLLTTEPLFPRSKQNVRPLRLNVPWFLSNVLSGIQKWKNGLLLLKSSRYLLNFVKLCIGIHVNILERHQNFLKAHEAFVLSGRQYNKENKTVWIEIESHLPSICCPWPEFRVKNLWPFFRGHQVK